MLIGVTRAVLTTLVSSYEAWYDPIREIVTDFMTSGPVGCFGAPPPSTGFTVHPDPIYMDIDGASRGIFT